MKETENQVEAHLEDHLERLPEGDAPQPGDPGPDERRRSQARTDGRRRRRPRVAAADQARNDDDRGPDEVPGVPDLVPFDQRPKFVQRFGLAGNRVALVAPGKIPTVQRAGSGYRKFRLPKVGNSVQAGQSHGYRPLRSPRLHCTETRTAGRNGAELSPAGCESSPAHGPRGARKLPPAAEPLSRMNGADLVQQVATSVGPC